MLVVIVSVSPDARRGMRKLNELVLRRVTTVVFVLDLITIGGLVVRSSL